MKTMKKAISIIVFSFFVFGLIPIKSVFAITQNQINAEVQIVCPGLNDTWFSGSGTIIDSKGIILTNKHVVTDQNGGTINTCFIGFTQSINNEPDFGTRANPNLAEVKYSTTTSDMDAAILYLNNPTGRVFPSVDIWNSNTDNLKFGDKVEVVGYPSIGGSTITYTSGDFSGFGDLTDGTQNYIKTNAQLEHGNSGGAAYASNGQFIGIPTMVVAGTLNSLSFILSVNSIKNWVSSILGNQYQQQITDQQPNVTTNSQTVLPNDITPPFLNWFDVDFYGYDANGKLVYPGNRDGNITSAVYEFPKVQFGWRANCKDDDCIQDNSGSIKGYYYYFGTNPKAIPKTDGTYISSADLLGPDSSNIVRISTIFDLNPGVNNYLILQAQDQANNVSGILINFLYIYEPDRFKDIKGFEVKDAAKKVIGELTYPKPEDVQQMDATLPLSAWLDYTNKDIFTNQNTLYLYPDFGYQTDGLTYYFSHGDDNTFGIWDKNYRTGKSTSDNFVKLANISTKGTVNVFIKPQKDSSTSFNGNLLLLRVNYSKNLNSKIADDQNSQNNMKVDSRLRRLSITVENTEADSNIVNRLKGYILLQAESHGEAWYINPTNGKRYYMKDGATAYQMLRNFGLGITDANLVKIPVDGDNEKYPSSVNQLLGRIMLQVEQHGEAWYLYPKTRKRYYMKDGDTAYQMMRNFGLGITNADLNKIPIGNM